MVRVSRGWAASNSIVRIMVSPLWKTHQAAYRALRLLHRFDGLVRCQDRVSEKGVVYERRLIAVTPFGVLFFRIRRGCPALVELGERLAKT